MRPPPPLAIRRRRRSDDAVSEVMGTVLLVALAVVMAGGFGTVVLGSMLTGTHQPPTAAFTLDAPHGAGHVDATMVSGSSFALGSARYVLLRNGTDVTGAQALLSPAVADRWSPGETLRIQVLGDPVGTFDRFFFLAGDAESGKSIGSTRGTVEGLLPAYRNNTLALSNGALAPSPLTADGRSVSNLTVDLAASFGREFVRSVTVNLSTVGGRNEVALVDDGTGGDAVAGDGTYTAQVSASNFTFTSQPQQDVLLPVTATDINGHRVTLQVASRLAIPSQPLASPGARYFDVPSSASIDRLWYHDFAFRDAGKLENDQAVLRVSDNADPAKGWTAVVDFAPPGSCGGDPGVTRIELFRDGVAGSVHFVPAGGCFPIGPASQIDLIDLNASRDAAGATSVWQASADSLPYNYTAAGIGADNEAVISFMGDAATISPLETGLGTAAVAWSTASGNRAPSSYFVVTLAPNAAPYMQVSVDGTGATDPDGAIASHAWTWGDTATGTGATASHAYATAGNYVVGLTVTDDHGATSTFTRTVTANRPPAISAFTHAALFLDVDVVTVAGDPDGHALTYAVAWGDAGAVTTGASGNVGHLYGQSGTYTITVYANDTLGGSAMAQQTVTVVGNGAPTLTSVANVTSARDVQVLTQGGDPEGGAVTYTFAWGDGAVTTGASGNVTHAYALAGHHVVTVYANDTFGASTSVQHPVLPNTAPVLAAFTGDSVLAELTVAANAGDPDGQPLSYTFAWGDGTVTTGASGNVTHAYAASGTYTVMVYANDTLGGSASGALVKVIASNLDPVVASFTNVTTDRLVQVFTQAGDPNGDTLAYAVAWGDGTVTDGPSGNVSHTYATAGIFTITVYANDTSGSDSASQVVFPNLAPSVTAIANVTTQLQVVLAVAAGDPDGQALSYTVAWGDGTAPQTGATANLTHAYAAAGNYTITVYANDTLGASAEAAHRAQVTRDPVITAYAASASNKTAILNASATNGGDAGETIVYHVEWGDGTGVDAAGPLSSLTRSYAASGTYTVTLYVNDSMGGKAVSTQSVLANAAPTFTSGPSASATDLNATIAATVVDPEGDAVTLTYAWGDGAVTTTGTRQYALPGNHTVTVYANDTNGRSTARSVVVTTTQTIYAAPVDVDAASPGGTFASLASLGRDNSGDVATLTETNTGSAASAVAGCDATFTFSAPLSCTAAGLTWRMNSTSGAGAAAWTITVDNSQGTPVVDGALQVNPSNTAVQSGQPGRINYHFNLSGAAGTTLTRLNLDWKMTNNGFSANARAVSAVLVAPNGTSVSIGSFSSVSTTPTWSAFSGTGVPDNFLTTSGTYLLRVDYQPQKNGDVLYLDNLYLNWTATNNYRAQKEIAIAPVPASGVNLHLEVRAAQSATSPETLQVQVWNGATWVAKANVTSTTMTQHVVLLAGAEHSGGTVRVRLVDALNSGDATQSAWTIDYVRVVARGP